MLDDDPRVHIIIRLDMVFLYTNLHVVIGYIHGIKVKPESINIEG